MVWVVTANKIIGIVQELMDAVTLLFDVVKLGRGVITRLSGIVKHKLCLKNNRLKTLRINTLPLRFIVLPLGLKFRFQKPALESSASSLPASTSTQNFKTPHPKPPIA